MAKVAYLEVVELLSETKQGKVKSQMDHLLARKKALAEENKDLDDMLDVLLRQLQRKEDDTKDIK